MPTTRWCSSVTGMWRMASSSICRATSNTRSLHLWMGECHVHASIRPEDIDALMVQYPDADLLLHPECGCVSQCLWRLAEGDLPVERTLVLSTGGMVRQAIHTLA